LIQVNEVAIGEVSADTAVAGEIFKAVADVVQWPVGCALCQALHPSKLRYENYE
jgi:hypothetical protein